MLWAAPGNGTNVPPMNQPAVGFIGVGVMGSSMAGHLLDAGHPVFVFNRTRARAEKLLGSGEVTRAYNVKVSSYTERAKQKLEEAGGKILTE